MSNKLKFNLDFLDETSQDEDTKLEEKKDQAPIKQKTTKRKPIIYGLWITFIFLFFITYSSISSSNPEKCKPLNNTENAIKYAQCVADDRGSAYWSMLFGYGFVFLIIFFINKRISK